MRPFTPSFRTDCQRDHVQFIHIDRFDRCSHVMVDVGMDRTDAAQHHASVPVQPVGQVVQCPVDSPRHTVYGCRSLSLYLSLSLSLFIIFHLWCGLSRVKSTEDKDSARSRTANKSEDGNIGKESESVCVREREREQGLVDFYSALPRCLCFITLCVAFEHYSLMPCIFIPFPPTPTTPPTPPGTQPITPGIPWLVSSWNNAAVRAELSDSSSPITFPFSSSSLFSVQLN